MSAPIALADDPPALSSSSEVSAGTWGKKAPVPAPQEAAQADGPTAAQQLLLQAMGLIGVRYKWGGNNPEDGLDCSGFVRYVFQNSLNIALPHNAMAMSRIGESVDRPDLKPGDLVFFNTLGRTFSHVGIYMGDNRFIHSPRAGKSVETANLGENYWQKRWNGARRIADSGGQGINLAGLLAVAGNPEAVQIAPERSRCKTVVQGKGKKKKAVTVCDRNARAEPAAKQGHKSAKPAKTAKSSKATAKTGTKAKLATSTKKKAKH
ncbi:C40 family peptidase [Andreprevotia sp. IGB-42]|uniref:C40 family peptidase n=1 Tax=Andreprevotia sp. IGB-42 TaxID=2497473 RepID=UPI00191DDB1E|nr:C40 family peptidase [Andreprevotia sp. IGB-42]